MDIARLIAKERAAGRHDSAVFGGFGAAVAAWADAQGAAELAALARRYAAATPGEREALLTDMEQLAVALPAMDAPAPAPLPLRDPTLALPLTVLKSIGDKKAQQFAKLGANDIGSLLELYPRYYSDCRGDAVPGWDDLGRLLAASGQVVSCAASVSRNNTSMLKCLLEGESGPFVALWFNQPFLEKRLRPGVRLWVLGRVQQWRDQLVLAVREYNFGGPPEGTPDSGLLPVYPATAGLNQKSLRMAMAAAWQRAGGHLPSIVPEQIARSRGLLSHEQALRARHFPADAAEAELARRTLAYEELLQLQLALARAAAPAGTVQRPPTDDAQLRQSFAEQLPFTLTTAQQRVIDELWADMNAPRPLSRLVQGDVGSGKTMVAAAAVYKCCAQGRQAVLMAPTELLARQHMATLQPLLQRLGLSCDLLIAATPPAERRRILSALAGGSLHCVIGTHALLQPDVVFARLGLAVIDEQHRFGVAQRMRLRNAAEVDLLVMTATPIPRTLAMTLYGDLALSVIDELPPGRQPVRTYAVDMSYEQRIYRFIDKEVAAGRQAFIVCPLIGADEGEDEEKQELTSAKQLYDQLSRQVFPQRRVALLHGRMKPQEKEAVMAAFRDGQSDILVSTTVIEVGVDVPNAAIMLIRNAERFGLAQLHQLRGRVGRGAAQSHCILLHDAHSEVAMQRLRTISTTHDGFKLAEADLEQRGPGEVFGQRQSGLPELKAADVFRDAALLEQAQQDAAQLLAAAAPLPPALEQRVEQLLHMLA